MDKSVVTPFLTHSVQWPVYCTTLYKIMHIRELNTDSILHTVHTHTRARTLRHAKTCDY